MATITVERPIPRLRSGAIRFIGNSVFAGKYHYDNFLDGLEAQQRGTTQLLASPGRDPEIAGKYNALSTNLVNTQELEIRTQFFNNFVPASFIRFLFSVEVLSQLSTGQFNLEHLGVMLGLAAITERAGLILTHKRLGPISDLVHNFSKTASGSPDSVRFARDTFEKFPQLQNQS